MNFFKSITLGGLFSSKTWWGALILAGQQLVEAYAVYKADHNAVAFGGKVLTILAALLTTIGLIDRTATPNTGKG
jgi:phosphatidylglycerophosphate synthase